MCFANGFYHSFIGFSRLRVLKIACQCTVRKLNITGSKKSFFKNNKTFKNLTESIIAFNDAKISDS